MRTLLASALVLGLALPAAAQPTFGIRAGLNVADVSNTFEDIDSGEFGFQIDAQPRLGFVGGLFVELPLTPTFAVRPEVLYSQKGAKAVPDADGVDDEEDVTLSLDYIEVPVLARVAIPASPTLEIGLLAGPSFGFKLDEGLESGDIDLTDGDEDFAASTDVGIAVGGEIGSGPFFVDLRYTFGLSDVSDGEADGDEGTPRNGVFAVTGTFKFGR